MPHEQFIPNDRAVWQSDTAKAYQCPTCERPIFSQHEGDDSPTVTCHGPLKGHTLRWNELTSTAVA